MKDQRPKDAKTLRPATNSSLGRPLVCELPGRAGRPLSGLERSTRNAALSFAPNRIILRGVLLGVLGIPHAISQLGGVRADGLRT